MWPNARISVMGGIQAADVLTTIKLDQKKIMDITYKIMNLKNFENLF